MQGQIIHIGNQAEHELFVLKESLYLYNNSGKPLRVVDKSTLRRVWLSIYNKITPNVEDSNVYEFLTSLDNFLKKCVWDKKILIAQTNRSSQIYLLVQISKSSSLLLNSHFTFYHVFNDTILNTNREQCGKIIKKKLLEQKSVTDAFESVESLYRTCGDNVLSLI